MTVTVPLTRGQCAIIDEVDAQSVLRFKWHAHPIQKATPGFYAVSSRDGVRGTIYLHRLIIGAAAGQFVDHINGNGLDNRRENLRIATRSQNNINRATQNHTGFRGVHDMSGGRYRAAVSVSRKRIYSARCGTPEEAARAYDELAIAYHGSFAQLNFPRGDA